MGLSQLERIALIFFALGAYVGAVSFWLILQFAYKYGAVKFIEPEDREKAKNES